MIGCDRQLQRFVDCTGTVVQTGDVLLRLPNLNRYTLVRYHPTRNWCELKSDKDYTYCVGNLFDFLGVNNIDKLKKY